ncbi:hypothetical protein [Bdellovibrio svalbardensis]|uniref:Uncharacterized protein n=1 Tax=Bdellovibrio svalbardensis TaxID=2972972 RepID=A0ABT6DLA0_9BACT|nr:hypothetical protein [Bdellovibrio svalbardensis]MDG0817657.1 hypothetical protein [Bdellovibrio svalbardensis]
MKSTLLAALVAITFGATLSHAADTAKKSTTSKAPPMEWTAVQRENMAKMHESMATCLRSSKSMSDCRAEMKTSCKEMGKEGCPMHGKGHHGMMSEEW